MDTTEPRQRSFPRYVRDSWNTQQEGDQLTGLEGRLYLREPATYEVTAFCFYCGGILQPQDGPHDHAGIVGWGRCPQCKTAWPRAFDAEGCPPCAEGGGGQWLHFYTAETITILDGRVTQATGRATCECGRNAIWSWKRSSRTPPMIETAAYDEEGELVTRRVAAQESIGYDS